MATKHGYLRNDMQKAATGDGPNPGHTLEPITVVDEFTKAERPVHINRSEFRLALQEAEARGDIQIKPTDAALFDRGLVRKGCIEHLYPNYAAEVAEEDGVTFTVAGGREFRKALQRNADGSPMIKATAADIVKTADHAYNADLKKAARELDAIVGMIDDGAELEDL
jgi:hypothetical protein